MNTSQHTDINTHNADATDSDTSPICDNLPPSHQNSSHNSSTDNIKPTNDKFRCKSSSLYSIGNAINNQMNIIKPLIDSKFNLKNCIEKFKTDITSLKNKNLELQQKLNDQEASREDQDNRLADVIYENTELSDQLEKLKKNLTNNNNEHDKQKTQLTAQLDDLIKQQNKFELQKTENENFRLQIERLVSDKNHLEKELKDKSLRNNLLEKYNKKIEDEKEDKQTTLDHLRSENNELIDKLKNEESNIIQLNEDIHHRKSRESKLKNQLETLQENFSKYKKQKLEADIQKLQSKQDASIQFNGIKNDAFSQCDFRKKEMDQMYNEYLQKVQQLQKEKQELQGRYYSSIENCNKLTSDKEEALKKLARIEDSDQEQQIKIVELESKISNLEKRLQGKIDAKEKIEGEYQAKTAEAQKEIIQLKRKYQLDIKPSEEYHLKINKLDKELADAITNKNKTWKDYIAAREERDKALKERNTAVKERDTAVEERAKIVKERDTAISVRKVAENALTTVEKDRAALEEKLAISEDKIKKLEKDSEKRETTYNSAYEGIEELNLSFTVDNTTEHDDLQRRSDSRNSTQLRRSKSPRKSSLSRMPPLKKRSRSRSRSRTHSLPPSRRFRSRSPSLPPSKRSGVSNRKSTNNNRSKRSRSRSKEPSKRSQNRNNSNNRTEGKNSGQSTKRKWGRARSNQSKRQSKPSLLSTSPRHETFGNYPNKTATPMRTQGWHTLDEEECRKQLSGQNGDRDSQR